MNNRYNRHQLIWRAIVTQEYTYAVTEDGEYALWDKSEGYQRSNLVNVSGYFEVRQRLWSQLNDWMDKAERPFLNNWFAKAASREIEAGNKEHGFGEKNNERTVYKPSRQ